MTAPAQAASSQSLLQSAFAAKAVLVLVGFCAVTAQIVLLREVIVLFNGNELSLGIVLATWLLWTAAGNALTSRLTRKRMDFRVPIALAQCLCGLSLPLTIWVLREARVCLQTVPGELMGLVPMALVSFVGLSVFCAVSGSLFALAAGFYRQDRAVSGGLATSYAYLFETAGSGLGGVLTSILLLPFFSPFQIAFLLLVLNLAAACWLMGKFRGVQLAVLALCAAIIAEPLIAVVAAQLEQTTEESLWRGFEVLGSRDSIYGRITLVEAGGMRSVYDSGSILANVPDPAAAEEAVHYALLEHPAPKNVLLLGGGINGSIAEALKHPTVERIDYIELDPVLISEYERFFPEESALAFADPRIHVHYADGRLFLKTADATFDAIIVNTPDPQTAQWNRFYTEEFFRTAREHLTPGGLLALQLRSSEEHIGPELAAFLRCMYRTIRQVFPYVAVVPGETLHLFAAAQAGVLTSDPKVLIARLQSRHLHTQYVREYFLPFRMAPDRMAQIEDLLQPLANTPVNRDLKPVAYYFGTVLWSAQFQSASARILERVERIRFRSIFAALAAACGVAFVLFAVRPRRERLVAGWSVGATGFTLMVLQILLLLAFQSVYGYVYHELALLIGMFMAGIGVGTAWGIRVARTADLDRLARAVAVNQLVVAIAAPLLLLFVVLIARISNAHALTIAGEVFPVLAVCCGFPGGFQFPVATAIYAASGPEQCSPVVLYSVDLVGGCAGALILAGVLIPVFGFWDTAWLTAALGFPPALLFRLRGRS
jgi:spermidine synthase